MTQMSLVRDMCVVKAHSSAFCALNYGCIQLVYYALFNLVSNSAAGSVCQNGFEICTPGSVGVEGEGEGVAAAHPTYGFFRSKDASCIFILICAPNVLWLPSALHSSIWGFATVLQFTLNNWHTELIHFCCDTNQCHIDGRVCLKIHMGILAATRNLQPL